MNYLRFFVGFMLLLSFQAYGLTVINKNPEHGLALRVSIYAGPERTILLNDRTIFPEAGRLKATRSAIEIPPIEAFPVQVIVEKLIPAQAPPQPLGDYYDVSDRDTGIQYYRIDALKKFTIQANPNDRFFLGLNASNAEMDIEWREFSLKPEVKLRIGAMTREVDIEGN